MQATAFIHHVSTSFPNNKLEASRLLFERIRRTAQESPDKTHRFVVAGQAFSYYFTDEYFQKQICTPNDNVFYFLFEDFPGSLTKQEDGTYLFKWVLHDDVMTFSSDETRDEFISSENKISDYLLQQAHAEATDWDD